MGSHLKFSQVNTATGFIPPRFKLCEFAKELIPARLDRLSDLGLGSCHQTLGLSPSVGHHSVRLLFSRSKNCVRLTMGLTGCSQLDVELLLRRTGPVIRGPGAAPEVQDLPSGSLEHSVDLEWVVATEFGPEIDLVQIVRDVVLFHTQIVPVDPITSRSPLATLTRKGVP